MIMVETFLVNEAKELIYDTDKLQEWKQKCEELGLENQLKLANGEASPIPFEKMNETQRRVFETICPRKDDYKMYSATAIPLEVLSLIALAEKERYFEKIEIWSDNKEPDPVAVGLIKRGYWDYDRYLIARWGHEIMAFEHLMQLAIKRYKTDLEIKLKKQLSQTQQQLSDIENNTRAYFAQQAESYEIGF